MSGTVEWKGEGAWRRGGEGASRSSPDGKGTSFRFRKGDGFLFIGRIDRKGSNPPFRRDHPSPVVQHHPKREVETHGGGATPDKDEKPKNTRLWRHRKGPGSTGKDASLPRCMGRARGWDSCILAKQEKIKRRGGKHVLANVQDNIRGRCQHVDLQTKQRIKARHAFSGTKTLTLSGCLWGLLQGASESTLRQHMTHKCHFAWQAITPNSPPQAWTQPVSP